MGWFCQVEHHKINPTEVPLGGSEANNRIKAKEEWIDFLAVHLALVHG